MSWERWRKKMKTSTSDLQLQSLLFWAIQNRDAINFRYGVEEIHSSLKIVTAVMNHNGTDFYGSAVGDVLKNVIGKAISECVERIVVRLNKWGTSNGAASHFDEELAIQNGYREIIERDAFLYHFHMGIVPSSFSKSHALHDVSLFHLESMDPDLFITMAYSNSNYSISLGNGVTKAQSQKKAEEEFGSIKASIDSHKITSIDLAEFSSIQRVEPVDHLRLAMDSLYQKDLKGWPYSGKSYQSREDLFPKKNLKINVVKPPAPFDSTGLVVAHVTNPDLLNYYLGLPSKEFFSQKNALKFLDNKNFDLLDLPHPFS